MNTEFTQVDVKVWLQRKHASLGRNIINGFVDDSDKDSD